jgi:hypothetical protein
MKFKQNDGQNQRIERITTSHLIVGIDMAKIRRTAIIVLPRVILRMPLLSQTSSVEAITMNTQDRLPSFSG